MAGIDATSAGWGVSLLVPFTAYEDDPGREYRIRNFSWLRSYWQAQLPLAEWIHGKNFDVPYSKTRAVNDAASRATGDIFVILDADAYFLPEVIETAAREIRIALKNGERRYYVPYRRFYRLTSVISEVICQSDPGNPLVLPDPPPWTYVEKIGTYSSGDAVTKAHWFAAMAICLPREAWECIGGMDERFQNWGSEDLCTKLALDALYTPGRTLHRPVHHLYHPRIGDKFDDRKWAGQVSAQANWDLAKRYREAQHDPAKMRKLVSER